MIEAKKAKDFMKNIIYIFLILLVAGCYKDEDIFVPDNKPAEEYVKTSFIGLVTDEEGNPIENATVYTGTERKETDINGVFYVENVEVNTRKAYFRVEKAGFFHASRVLSITRATQQTINFTLIRNQDIGTFAATDGETLNLPGGAVLEVATNAFDGYSDMVTGNGYYFDQNPSQVSPLFPTDLLAVNENGDEQVLVSYGGLAVQFRDNNENVLTTFSSPVTIKIPVNDDLNPPSTVGLWYLDEADGIWKEGGTATLIGGEYVGEINQDGYWNLAVAYDFVEISGKVINEGEPVGNIPVGIQLENGVIQYHFTNLNGFYYAKVPANDDLTIGVYQVDCNVLETTISITTGNVNMDIPDLVNPIGISNYTGTLINCENEAVTNGYVILDNRLILRTEAGQFNGAILSCRDIVSFAGLDKTTIVNAEDLTITRESPMTVNVLACTTNPEIANLIYDGDKILDLPGNINVEVSFVSELAATDGKILIESDGGLFEATFKGANQGVYTINTMKLIDNINMNEYLEATPDMQVRLDQTVSNGSYITGSISGSFTDSDGTAHPISGDFRVKRDN